DSSQVDASPLPGVNATGTKRRRPAASTRRHTGLAKHCHLSSAPTTKGPSGESPLNSGAPVRPRSSIWDGARLKLVALIGAIVAATIISVIVAVVTSARHADAISIAQERGRLT